MIEFVPGYGSHSDATPHQDCLDEHDFVLTNFIRFKDLSIDHINPSRVTLDGDKPKRRHVISERYNHQNEYIYNKQNYSSSDLQLCTNR